MENLDHVPFRGLIRGSALARTGGLLLADFNPFDSFGSELRLMTELALLGEVLLARSVLTAGSEGGHIPVLIATFGFLVPAIALLNFSQRRWRFALGVAACLLATVATGQGHTIATARSFFGIYRVSIEGDSHASFLKLMDGTTLHGVRSLVPGE
jgi:hypothetical protein